MRFGVHLAANGPLAEPARIASLAARAEALGFDSVWVADHVLFPVGFETAYPYRDVGWFNAEWSYFYDPLTTLAWVAGQTSRVEIGTSVLVAPMRNPLYLAKQTATLDRLSNGRFVLGAGVGWLREEYQALQAAPFDQRGAVMDEWIGLLRRLWSGEEVEHQGDHYQHGPVVVRPTPARGGGPPIVIGGVGAAAIRRAGAIGDGWLPVMVAPEALAQGIAAVRDRATALGRDAAALRFYAQVNLSKEPDSGDEHPARIRLPNGRALAKLRAYRDAGCQEMVFGEIASASTEQLLATIEWVATELRPRLDDA